MNTTPSASEVVTEYGYQFADDSDATWPDEDGDLRDYARDTAPGMAVAYIPARSTQRPAPDLDALAASAAALGGTVSLVARDIITTPPRRVVAPGQQGLGGVLDMLNATDRALRAIVADAQQAAHDPQVSD